MATRLWMVRGALVAVGFLGTASQLAAQGFLQIPSTIDGYPTNVGLLILGHSTSAQGQYPAKLLAALNDEGVAHGGRNYVAFRAITGSDGGLLWSRLATVPGHPQYDRLTASATVGEANQPQWCEDEGGVRWSCRRAKAEEILTGTFPIPSTGTCADPAVANGCKALTAMTCSFFDRTIPLESNPVVLETTPHECWLRMDFRIVLVQDTSNRSWPIDDFTGDGRVDAFDLWPAERISRVRALPCLGNSGVVAGFVDVNCDQELSAADAAHFTYATWLRSLAEGLMDEGAYEEPADFVVLTHKPTEMGQCNLFPAAEQARCLNDKHAIRSPQQVAETPARPFDHYHVPTVYWEYRVFEQLAVVLPAGSRIRMLSPVNPRAMWQRSSACYAVGIGPGEWTIPASVEGRPTTVAADDSETDGGAAPNSGAVGCMTGDHIHHNEAGGWLMADTWYRGLAPLLWSGVFQDGFESGGLGLWSSQAP